MPPRRLREGALREDRRHAGLAARRVVAVDECAEREERQVLHRRHGEGETALVDVDAPAELLEGEPEGDAVADMYREARLPPTRATGDELAKQGDVGVVVAEDPLVDRLLERPRARGDGSGRY